MNEKDKELIFHGRVFDVETLQVEVEGRYVRRDLVIHHGGVAISALRDGKILLVRQSRVGAGCKTLEIPAGTLEPGEKPEICGMRELNEETGWQADRLELISACWPTPGYDTEVIWIYHAENLSPVSKRLDMDEGEDIEQVWLDLAEAYSLIQKGEIRDAKTIIAIQHEMLRQNH